MSSSAAACERFLDRWSRMKRGSYSAPDMPTTQAAEAGFQWNIHQGLAQEHRATMGSSGWPEGDQNRPSGRTMANVLYPDAGIRLPRHSVT